MVADWVRVLDLVAGEYSLAAAFWFFLIFGTFGAAILGTVVASPLVWVDGRPAALLVFHLIFWGWMLAACVGVWRSANAILIARVQQGQKATYWEGAKIVGAKLVVMIWPLGQIMRMTGKPVDVLVTDVLRFMHVV